MRSMELLSVLLVCVFASGSAGTTKKLFYFPPAAAEKIVDSTVKCISKLGFDASIINQLKEGKYAEDVRMVESLLCMMQNIGIGYKDGRPNVDKIMHDLFANDSEIRAVMEGCNKDWVGKSPVHKLQSFFVCFRDAAPIKIMFK